MAKSPIFVCLLLAVVTFAVYGPVVQFDFIDYDDPNYVVNNVRVHQGLTWDGLTWALSTWYMGYWQPMTWLSFMLDAQVFGVNPAGMHLVNVCFHVANTLLVFLVLRRMTGAYWQSAFTAALFGLHPLRVESVAWICERRDVLSAFFGLLALLFYTRYARSKGQHSKFDIRNYSLALLFFLLGLMSKPILVTLPFLLLLLDYWPLARGSHWKRLIAEKVPFLVLSGIFCLLTVLAHSQANGIYALTTLSLPERVVNALVSYALYLSKTFWPVDLAILYPLQEHWPWWQVFFAAALLVGLCAYAIFAAKTLPFIVTGWFWFLVGLIPVIGLVQVGMQSMADRFTYFPLLGIFIVVAWGGAHIVSRLPRTLVVVGVVVVLVACSARTMVQLQFWRNSGTVFEHAARVTKNNYIAHNNAGGYLAARLQWDEAIAHYRQALQINSNHTLSLSNLGSALLNQGQTEEAMKLFKRALQLDPKMMEALNNIGFALAKQGRYAEAIPYYENALQVKSDHPMVHVNLGIALSAQVGRRDDAMAHLREALRLDPDNVQAKRQLQFLAARPENIKSQ